jgi:large subunit ribosomal protein L9
MATTLQVVLQSNVDKVGESGELVKVRPGFARNYLIPRGLAVPATTAAVNRIAHERAVGVAKAEKTKKEFQAVAEQINALKLTLSRSVGEDDKMFGSVTTKEIENAAKAAGVTIDRKKMVLSEPLKALGSFEIPVRLMTDVTATLKVEIVKK